MKKLKCTSCGGEMTVDTNNEYATCNYCGTKYKLNDDINININVDDDIKNAFNNGISHVGKLKYLIFVPIILFVTIVTITIISFTSMSNNMKDNFYHDEAQVNNEKFDEMYDQGKEMIENIQNQQNSYMFNNEFEMFSGMQDKFFVEELLNSIITNNQKNKNQLISVIYKEKNTTDVNEIVNIQKSLTSEKLTVIFDYDEKGYINKVTISE